MFSLPRLSHHFLVLIRSASGRFLEYILDREDVKGPWREHTHHSFVQQLANGTLPLGKFKNYLIQDYLFLVSKTRMALEYG